MKTMITYLKYSWKFLVGYRRIFFFNLLLKFISLVCSLCLPLFSAELITSISHMAIQRAIYTILLIIGIQAFSIILGYIIGRIENHITRNVSCNVQKTLEQQIMEIPPYLMSEYNDGILFSMILRDSTSPISYIFTLSSVLFSIINLIGIGIIIFFLSWELALLIICTYPIIYIINKVYGKKLRKKQEECLTSSDGFVNYLKDIITSLNFIKENNGEMKVGVAYVDKVDDVKKKSLQLETLKLNNNLFLGIIGLLGYAAVNIVGIILIVAGKLLFGNFVAFNGYSTKFSTSLDSIVSLNAKLQPTFVVFQRLSRLNELYQKSLEFNANQEKIDRSNIEIVAEDLSISLSERTIFEGIGFSLNAGQMIKIRGRNGCGKTTILKILMQEYKQYEGRVRIGGMELKDISYLSIQNNLTYLRQNAPLLPLTIFDNITLFDFNQSIKEEDVIQVCKKVGLWDDLNALPEGLQTQISDQFNLSAGQIQKLQFARALLKNSPIILIDEVTANLDKTSISSILDLCEKMKTDSKSILYVSHLNEERILADKYLDFA